MPADEGVRVEIRVEAGPLLVAVVRTLVQLAAIRADRKRLND